MKKILLAISLTILFPFAIAAQSISNGGFENWFPNSYEDLDYYQTSNFTNTLLGLPLNVIKLNDPQQGSFAVQLTTVANATDTSFGYFINGDPNTLEGGIPYNQHPLTLTGFYKCNIPAGDTGIILIIFKEMGTAVSFDAGQFYGVHNTYTPFTVTLNIPALANPDTVLIGAVSSNAFVSQGIPGSTLQLDNLSFTGTSIQPANLNGSFENWNTHTQYLPFDWEVAGDSIFRSNNAHSGNHCLQLTNAYYGGSGINPGVATSGHFGNNGPEGGRPYTLQMDTLVGWYKFLPVGIDSATVWISCTNMGMGVGGAYIGLPAASVWTPFSIPFSSMTAPDTLQITFGAVYNNFDSTNAGSVMFVDDISLRSSPLSTGINWNQFGLVTLFPNPAEDISWLEFTANGPGEIRITITDATGRIVSENEITGSGKMRYQIDCAAFDSGIYTVLLEQDDARAVRRFIKK